MEDTIRHGDASSFCWLWKKNLLSLPRKTFRSRENIPGEVSSKYVHQQPEPRTQLLSKGPKKNQWRKPCNFFFFVFKIQKKKKRKEKEKKKKATDLAPFTEPSDQLLTSLDHFTFSQKINGYIRIFKVEFPQSIFRMLQGHILSFLRNILWEIIDHRIALEKTLMTLLLYLAKITDTAGLLNVLVCLALSIPSKLALNLYCSGLTRGSLPQVFEEGWAHTLNQRMKNLKIKFLLHPFFLISPFSNLPLNWTISCNPKLQLWKTGRLKQLEENKAFWADCSRDRRQFWSHFSGFPIWRSDGGLEGWVPTVSQGSDSPSNSTIFLDLEKGDWPPWRHYREQGHLQIAFLDQKTATSGATCLTEF